jgi:Fe2+ transport system protein FeoA
MNLNKQLNLSMISKGTMVKMVSIQQHPASERLLALGLFKDSKIIMKRKSPFGNAYIIEVENRYLALRKEELELINVELV